MKNYIPTVTPFNACRARGRVEFGPDLRGKSNICCAIGRKSGGMTKEVADRRVWARIASGPGAGFLRVVVGEGGDPGGQALLLAVEFADLDLGAQGRMGDVETREGDGLAKYW